MTLEEVREVFAQAVSQYHRRSSTVLYAYLTEAASHDDDILALMLPAIDTAKVSIMLHIIVHYLLLKDYKEGKQNDLALYYASITPEPLPSEDAYPLFRAFCLQHAGEIRHLAATRYVQYSSLGRAACMIPAYHLVAQRLNGQSFAMLDIGTGAGLLLLWDKFAYDYGIHQIRQENAPVTIACAVQGELLPPLPDQPVSLSTRLGVEVDPIDLEDLDERLWLKASIPAYNRLQADAINRAIQSCRRYKPPIIQGDACTDIVKIGAEFAPDQPLCLVDSFIPPELRDIVDEQTRQLAQQRPVFQVTLASLSQRCSVRLIDYVANEHMILAYTNILGSYIEWTDEATATGYLKPSGGGS